MEISAYVRNRGNDHEVRVGNAAATVQLDVAAKPDGGSAVNGGELLMAALATCYCNDLYREAARLGIAIRACEVVATARFGGIGSGAASIVYAARVESSAPAARVELLLAETDRLAEIHNTLRAGCPVQRIAWEAGTGSGMEGPGAPEHI